MSSHCREILKAVRPPEGVSPLSRVRHAYRMWEQLFKVRERADYPPHPSRPALTSFVGR
jgi:hypothetical protein